MHFFLALLIILTTLHCLFFSISADLSSLLSTGTRYHIVAVVIPNVVVMYF